RAAPGSPRSVRTNGQPHLHPHGAAAVHGHPGSGRPHCQLRPHRLPGRLLRQELPDAGAGRARVPPLGARHHRLLLHPAERHRGGHRRRAAIRGALPLHQLPVQDSGAGVHKERMGIRFPSRLPSGRGPFVGCRGGGG
ncbi:Os06g0246600, partial [Oryza sativa Japonica Group]